MAGIKTDIKRNRSTPFFGCSATPSFPLSIAKRNHTKKNIGKWPHHPSSHRSIEREEEKNRSFLRDDKTFPLVETGGVRPDRNTPDSGWKMTDHPTDRRKRKKKKQQAGISWRMFYCRALFFFLLSKTRVAIVLNLTASRIEPDANRTSRAGIGNDSINFILVSQ